MATYKKKIDFFETEAGATCREILAGMESDKTYATQSSYSANSELYPDNLIPFVNKHMDYLRCHPALDAKQYLANLRLMTRVKPQLAD